MTAVRDVTPPRSFEFLRSEGSPREVGQAHGDRFASQVRSSLAVYRQKFDRMKLAWSDARDLAETALGALRTFDPLLAEEIYGIAEGADVAPAEIMAINVRTGITRMIQEGVAAEDHECTTVSVMPEATADGHTLIGQNWDQSAVFQPNTVVIEQHIEGQPAVLFVTEAGILFRHGMNDAGVGLVGNGLSTNREARADNGMPAPFARRRALRQTCVEDAFRVLDATPRSHSGNHMIADSTGKAVDVEAVPGQTFPLYPEEGILVHSNHFMHPEAQASLEDRMVKNIPDSLFRDGRVRDALRGRWGKVTVETVKSALKDHFGFPKSVCRHPEPGSDVLGYTLVSTVMDLTDKRMWTAPGPACAGTYSEYRFT